MTVLSEFEDKLQSILGNPEAMEQILSMARSISGNPPAQDEPETPDTLAPQTFREPSVDPFSMLNGLDPRLVQLGMRLLSEYSREDNRTVALLTALQPFLKQDRYPKMDQAVQIARLSRVIRVALETFRKGETDDV